MSIDLLLSMLFYYNSQFEKSYVYMNEFLKHKPVTEYLYFYACKDYISFRANTKDISMTFSVLNESIINVSKL